LLVELAENEGKGSGLHGNHATKPIGRKPFIFERFDIKYGRNCHETKAPMLNAFFSKPIQKSISLCI
jgi:hypothetical protein